MANPRDPEKEGAGEAETAAVDNASATEGSTSETPQLATLKETLNGGDRDRRHSRVGSVSSDDSDPLSPLELALTPDLRTEGEHAAAELTIVRTTTSVGSSASRPPDFEVVFEDGDVENPRNWPLWYRAWVIFSVSFATWVIVVYSTSYTSSIPGLMEQFAVESETVATLGVTTYLLGLAVGSVVVAPMSELYGRRPVYLICLTLFTILVIPCAVATSLAEIIVVRFFGAFFGAAMVSNSPGTIVDMVPFEYLALAMSCWSIAPLNGPVFGPVIGGFVFEYLGWRWDNWLVLIMAGVATLVMTTVKETYAPTLLQRKAARLRKETGDERYWSRFDTKVSTVELLKLNLSRPFVLSFTEPILWFFNIWISILYGILYLCFVAYPLIYQEERGWSAGTTGLSFIGIGIGSTISIVLEPLWRRIINSHAKDPETGRVPPEASAAIMSIGAILAPIGQLVFSWTSLPISRPWALPIAFGIPFGMGNTLAFIYGSNYLAGSYGLYAASALAGNAVMRSFFGGTLPLAGPSMYAAMTPQWAGTFLGLLEVLLIPIPLTFYRYGDRIRAKSKVIRQMREEQLRNDDRRAKQQAKLARRADRAAAAEATATGLFQKETGAEGALGETDVEKAAGLPPTGATTA